MLKQIKTSIWVFYKLWLGFESLVRHFEVEFSRSYNIVRALSVSVTCVMYTFLKAIFSALPVLMCSKKGFNFKLIKYSSVK